MTTQRVRSAGNALPFLLYALALIAYLYLCRLIIVHQAHIPRETLSGSTFLEAAKLMAMDALAVSLITIVTLGIARASAAMATVFMTGVTAYLALTGAINVGVMRVYHQPATINLVSYGNFLQIPGLRSLARYITGADKLVFALGLALIASFALMPAVRRWRALESPIVRRILVPLSAAALVALPLSALIQHGEARGASAGWWLARSVLVPPTGRAADVQHPDMRDPFATYSVGADRQITSPAKMREAATRNVLVVVLESVGTDYLELQPAAAPNLRRLSTEGAYFPNAYAPMPSSPMSLFSLMTGMYPPVSARAIPMVEPDFPAPTLFEALRSSGRRTAVFSANWGFMDFDRYLKGRVDFLEQTPDAETCGASGLGEACSFASLKQWIGQSTQPFAAMLWTYGTHYPYGSDAGTLAGDPRLAERLYLARLKQSDALVGGLVDWLQEQGRLDQTLLVIVGDHGEAFLQHGTLSHGNDVYRETVRVPLMLVNRRLFSGRTDPSPVRIIDVGPTVLSLAHVPVPATFQGVDLATPLRPRRAFFAAAWLNLVMGFTEGRMKFDYSYVTDRLEAFDVQRDPHERVDVAGRLGPGERTAIIRRIMNWKAAADAKAEAVRSSAKGR